MIEVTFDDMSGVTVGQKKDGSRCILWENNSLEWWTAENFAWLIGA